MSSQTVVDHSWLPFLPQRIVYSLTVLFFNQHAKERQSQKNQGWGLERWLCSQRHLLFLQRTGVLLPIPMWNGSDASVASVPGILHSLLASVGAALTYTYQSQTSRVGFRGLLFFGLTVLFNFLFQARSPETTAQKDGSFAHCITSLEFSISIFRTNCKQCRRCYISPPETWPKSPESNRLVVNVASTFV